MLRIRKIENTFAIVAAGLILALTLHDARLEYVAEMAQSPLGTYAEQIYKAESIILGDNAVSRLSNNESADLISQIQNRVETKREAATRSRREDKEKDTVLNQGSTPQYLYASA